MGKRSVGINPENVPGFVNKCVDTFLKVQNPVIVKNVNRLRQKYPSATPADILELLRKQYLNSVTTAGAGLGMVAVVPGVGTVAALALGGSGTLFFLEASSLYAQSIASVYGITVNDPERVRALVLTILMGSAGVDIVRQFASQVVGTGPTQQVFWAQLVAERLPNNAVRQLSTKLQRKAMQSAAEHQARHFFGKLLPYGLGALVGGVGNRILARKIVQSANTAFGSIPLRFPAALE